MSSPNCFSHYTMAQAYTAPSSQESSFPHIKHSTSRLSRTLHRTPKIAAPRNSKTGRTRLSSVTSPCATSPRPPPVLAAAAVAAAITSLTSSSPRKGNCFGAPTSTREPTQSARQPSALSKPTRKFPNTDYSSTQPNPSSSPNKPRNPTTQGTIPGC